MKPLEDPRAQVVTLSSVLALDLDSRQCSYPIWESTRFRPCKYRTSSQAPRLRQKAIHFCKTVVSDENRDTLIEALRRLLQHCFCTRHTDPERMPSTLVESIIENWRQQAIAKWKTPISSSEDDLSSEFSDNEEVGRTAGVIHISKHTRKHTTSSQTHESQVVEEEEELEATIVVEEPVKAFAKWPTKTLEDKLLKTLGAKDSSKRRVYIATCEELFPGLVKVGEAANVIGRLGSHQEHWGAEFKCLWQSEEPFYGAHRVEQLILAEFRGERVSRKCVSTKCRKSHTEFLTTEPETVKAAAKCWERWLKEGRPYEDTMLNARWTNIIKAMVTKNRVPTAQNLIESLDQDDQLCDSPSHEEQLTNTSTHRPRQLAPKISATTPTDRSSSISTSPSPHTINQQRMTSSISRILTEFVDDDSPFYDCSTITAVEDEASARDSVLSKLSQEVSEDAASPLLSIPGAFPSDSQDSVDAVASDKYLRTRLQAKHVHSGAKCLPLRNSSQSET